MSVRLAFESRIVIRRIKLSEKFFLTSFFFRKGKRRTTTMTMREIDRGGRSRYFELMRLGTMIGKVRETERVQDL